MTPTQNFGVLAWLANLVKPSSGTGTQSAATATASIASTNTTSPVITMASGDGEYEIEVLFEYIEEEELDVGTAPVWCDRDYQEEAAVFCIGDCSQSDYQGSAFEFFEEEAHIGAYTGPTSSESDQYNQEATPSALDINYDRSAYDENDFESFEEAHNNAYTGLAPSEDDQYDEYEMYEDESEFESSRPDQFSTPVQSPQGWWQYCPDEMRQDLEDIRGGYTARELAQQKVDFAFRQRAFFYPETPLRRGNFGPRYLRGEQGTSPRKFGFLFPKTNTPELDSRDVIGDEDRTVLQELPISFDAFDEIEEAKLPLNERVPKRKADLFDEVLGSPGEDHVYEYDLAPPPGDIMNLRKPCRRRYHNDDGSSPAIGGKSDTSGWVTERHNDVGLGRPTVVIGLFGEDLLAEEKGHTWKLLA